MHQRYFSTLFRTATFAVIVTTPLLSFGQAAAPAAPAETPASTNAAPAATAPVAPAPAAAPTPAPAETTPATPEERPTSYTMVTGDSLDSIAKKFNTSIKALAKLNKIPKSKYRKLRAGTVLQIPPEKTESSSAK